MEKSISFYCSLIHINVIFSKSVIKTQDVFEYTLCFIVEWEEAWEKPRGIYSSLSMLWLMAVPQYLAVVLKSWQSASMFYEDRTQEIARHVVAE